MLAEQALLPCESHTIVRPMTAGDRNFVLSTWLKSHRNSPRGKQFRKSRDYYRHERPFVEALIGSAAKVLVAADIDSPTVIFGWLCYQPGTLHYVYVKRETFRGQYGIAALLHRHAALGPQFVCTHRTASGEDWLRQSKLVGEYIPIEDFYEQAA